MRKYTVRKGKRWYKPTRFSATGDGKKEKKGEKEGEKIAS